MSDNESSDELAGIFGELEIDSTDAVAPSPDSSSSKRPNKSTRFEPITDKTNDRPSAPVPPELKKPRTFTHTGQEVKSDQYKKAENRIKRKLNNDDSDVSSLSSDDGLYFSEDFDPGMKENLNELLDENPINYKNDQFQQWLLGMKDYFTSPETDENDKTKIIEHLERTQNSAFINPADNNEKINSLTEALGQMKVSPGDKRKRSWGGKTKKRLKNKKRKTMKKNKRKWSKKYKKSINCKKPKGFSQKQYCKYGRKKRKTKKNRK